MLIWPSLVYEYTNLKKRPSCCAGSIPTEFGLCTAMRSLWLNSNQLTGEHFFAQIDRLVSEYTILQSSEFFDARVLCAKNALVSTCTVLCVRAVRLPVLTLCGSGSVAQADPRSKRS